MLYFHITGIKYEIINLTIVECKLVNSAAVGLLGVVINLTIVECKFYSEILMPGDVIK